MQSTSYKCGMISVYPFHHYFVVNRNGYRSDKFFLKSIGYATSDDHWYLINEYARNSSLDDHPHDPLLKGTEARL